MSLCAEDLKKLLERPELSFKASLAVCTSAASFLDDVQAAFHRLMGAAPPQQAHMVFLLFVLGDDLGKTLPLRCINTAVKRVKEAFSADCELFFDVLTDEHLDGGLCVLAVGMPV